MSCRNAVALGQYEIRHTVLGVQIAGLTGSRCGALDVVGNQTYQRHAHQQQLTLSGIRLDGKRFIEVSSVLMFAVPGTVLGISYILGFNSKPLALTGTGLILVIVFTFRNMPVAIESGTTTLLQIDNSIEEASTILGADTGYSFRRITLPMLKNAFFSGIVYSFTKAITAVSAVIFLVSPRWKLVTSNIYSLFDLAKYGQAAAFVTMMVGILLVFIGLFNTVINFLLAPRSKVPQAKTKTEESK